MKPLRSALLVLRAALEAASRAVDGVEAAMGAHDDELLELAAGAYGRPGATLARWAREGRLRAFEAERGVLVAWRSDVREAIEAQPARRLRAIDVRPDADPLAQALESGELRVGDAR